MAPTTDPMLDITILARDLLRLNPRLRLRLTPLSSTAPMAITTPVFTLDFTTPTSTAPTTDPMVDITILARDLLRLNPRLRLRLTPLSSTAPMAMVTPVFTLDFTTPTSMAPTTDPMVDITILARDLLKLSLLLRLLLILRLIPTFSTAMAIPTPMVMPVFITPMPTAPIITDLMDMPTGDKRLSESSQKKKYKR